MQTKGWIGDEMDWRWNGFATTQLLRYLGKKSISRQKNDHANFNPNPKVPPVQARLVASQLSSMKITWGEATSMNKQGKQSKLICTNRSEMTRSNIYIGFK